MRTHSKLLVALTVILSFTCTAHAQDTQDQSLEDLLKDLANAQEQEGSVSFEDLFAQEQEGSVSFEDLFKDLFAGLSGMAEALEMAACSLNATVACPAGLMPEDTSGTEASTFQAGTSGKVSPPNFLGETSVANVEAACKDENSCKDELANMYTCMTGKMGFTQAAADSMKTYVTDICACYDANTNAVNTSCTNSTQLPASVTLTEVPSAANTARGSLLLAAVAACAFVLAMY
eukprot:5363478-Pyramimonas_sp.AAC.1